MTNIKKEICEKYNHKVTNNSFEIKYDKITPEVLKNLLILMKNKNINLLIGSIFNFNDNILDGIINTCMDDYYKKALIKLTNNMRTIIENDGEEVFECFCDIKFARYINILDDSYFARRLNLYTFIKDYKFNTNINNFYTNPKLFNKYIKDPQKKEYKINDINKYEEIREKYFINIINNDDKNKVEKIISSYFNYDYIKFKELLSKIDKMNIEIKNKKLFSYLINIENYDKKELLYYIKFIKGHSDYFKNLEIKIKEASLNDISKNLTVIKNNQQIITLDKEPFTLLIHKIKGLLNKEITQMLNSDITYWDKHYIENGYISCSLINELYIACATGNYLTIGFSNIKPSDILAINTKDINFIYQDIIANNNDKASNYMSKDMLLDNSELYNEIVINRYREKNAIMPDYILAFDNINTSEKEVSEKLNIPIYIIILEAYADVMIDILQKLKENNDPRYMLLLKRFSKQLNYRYTSMHNYYNKILESEALKTDSKEANKLIIEMNKKMNKKS